MLNEKRTEATVYVKTGLEGTPNVDASSTREFKLTHEEKYLEEAAGGYSGIVRFHG